MKTKSIGEILREEREYHRLSLESLAKRTRIRQEYLQALEQNEFDALPAAAFVKGYIKTYGQVFGFDSTPLLALLRRDFKESAKGTLVPREFIKPVLKKRQWWTPLTSTFLIAGGIFVAILGYVVVQWISFNQPPTVTLASPTENQVVAAQVIVQGKTEVDVVVTVNDQPVALQTNGSFETEVFLATEGPNSLKVKATDRRGKTSTIERTVYVKF